MWCGIRWLGGIDKNFRLTEHKNRYKRAHFRGAKVRGGGSNREQVQLQTHTVAGVEGVASHIC
jgi:hypothetical protein